MRIYHSITFDIETWTVLASDFYEYSGTVAQLKGDGKASAQLKRNNAIEDTAIKRTYENQDKAAGLFNPNEGFTPEALAALRTSFLNSNDSAYNSAGSSVRAAINARGGYGGATPVGGDYVRGISELEGGRASSQSGGLNSILIQNYLQQQQNKANLANVYTGNAATSSGIAGLGSSGASNALNQYVAASNTGFGNAFTTAFGGTLGKNLASLGTGALSGGLDKIGIGPPK